MDGEWAPMRSLLAAIRFLTRLPVPAGNLTEQDIGRSAVFFPVVGLLIGGILLGFYRFFSLIFPVPVARLLVLMSLVAISGAFHLDGLADTVDGFYGGKDREEVLRIMRDPHVGAMGAVAIVTILLLKTAAVVSLSEAFFRKGILIMPAVGRGATVVALMFPYARDGGLGWLFAQHRSRLDPVAAAVLVSGAAIYAFGPEGVWAVLGSLAAAGGVLGLAWRRIRGVTGDVCGAVNEAAECAFLLALLAVSPGSFPFP